MVGTGLLMLAASWLAAWQLRRHGAPTPWLARGLVAMSFSGWVATVAGWYVTEIGRQPYLVYGVLTTAQATSDVPAPMIATTLAMYLILYAGLTLAYITVLFHLARKAGHGEDAPYPAPDKAMPAPPAHPQPITA